MSSTKTLGVVAAIAAIAAAAVIPTALTAHAEPTTPTTPAEPATAETELAVPPPMNVPDPQGPGCDAYRNEIPGGAGSFASMASQKASQAIANNPDLSTFSAAISGRLNPDVNVIKALDGGPYVVFAPTDAAFSKLDAETIATLKSDPTVLLPLLYYHMVLGYLGPKDVAGKMPTQDGRLVLVTGEGGDVKVNDVAKLTCAYTARGAYIYMIDTVLTPPSDEDPTAATTSTTATSTTATSTTATSTAATSTTEATATETATETVTETATSEATTSAKPAA
ncbi:MAG: fasciclin domain-containing protein [Mycobacterium sp.]